MASRDRSRSRARSQSRTYEEELTIRIPSRANSRVRISAEEDYSDTIVNPIRVQDRAQEVSRQRSRSRSRTTVYHEEDLQNCVPCNMIRASSTLKKRLIVCCDGTFCAADKGKENNPTNIARLTRVIANMGLDSKGRPVPQIVNYQSGVATGHLTALNKASQGAFGYGLNEKVCEAYTFLVNNYGPGDEIFIFGFSRGAYTARSLASFICQVGLLSPGMMDYFNEIFQAYKFRDRRAGENTFKDMEWARRHVRPGELGFDSRRTDRVTRYDWVRQWTHLHAKVKVVGVFDTVGSVGVSGWTHQPGRDIDWHATKLHPKIEYAFHAMALDESRGNFPPTLFYRDQACKDAGVVLHQCWFPGYHCCVGGQSNPQKDINSVDEVTFAWMIDQLTRYNLLQINRAALRYPVLDRLSMDYAPIGHNPVRPRNPQEVHERRIEWSDGILEETDTLFWHVASELATQRWNYIRKPGEYQAHDPRTGRRIESADFEETIHPTVWHRIQNRNYEPRCLPLSRWKRYKVSDGGGYEWIKASKSGLMQVCIPEYVIPSIAKWDSGMDFFTGSLERKIAPPDYMLKLDQGNGLIAGSKRPSVHGRVDSGYGGEYDDNYLSPTRLTRLGSRDEQGGYFQEKVTVRESSPRRSSRGAAAEYYESAVEY